MESPPQNKKWIPLGKVLREWGIKGQVKVEFFNPHTDLPLKLKKIEIQRGDQIQSLQILSAKKHGKHWRLHFAGYESPEAARNLRAAFLGLPRDVMPDLASDEFYLVDLEGLKVLSHEGKELGRIQAFQQVGDSDVMVVGKSFRDSVWVPYEKDFIKRTSISEGVIILTELAQDLWQNDSTS